jgi:hypothetical protein
MCSRANWARRGDGAGGERRRPPRRPGPRVGHPAARGRLRPRPCPQGQWHQPPRPLPNRRYATLARELGLDVAHLQPIGWSATSVPTRRQPATPSCWPSWPAAPVLWRRAEQAAPVGPGRSRNALACSGACGWRIRVGPLAAGSGPDPVWRLRPALRARGRRARLTRTSLRLLCAVKLPGGFRRRVGRSVPAVGTAGGRGRA